MAVDAATFRSVLGQWPSGVTVVTTVADDGWHGMTASSFNSVSLEPPLVSVCLAKKIYTHTLIERSGVFAVNILAKDQAAIGKRFAGQQPELTDRFAGLQASTAESGAPVLGDALGWLDCRVVHAYEGGDHTIFVGEVLAADTPRLTAPLLFHSRAWGQFADLLPADAAVVDTGIAAALRAKGADPRRVTELVSALRDAGVTVRVLDLASGAPSEDELAALRADRDAGPGTASALVATPEHVEAAAALGVGVVEVAVAADAAAAEAARPVIEAAHERGLAVSALIAGFFSGDPAAALDACAALAALGADEICLDDAEGAATPLSVRELLQEAVSRTKPAPLSVRLGDQSGLALANALTALKSGVRRFHATLGGVDGVVALEDVLYLVSTLEVEAPADRDAVVRAARALAPLWGAPLNGRTTRLQTPAPADPLIPMGGTP